MKEVLNYLKNNPTFYIATCDGDQPRVRPFGAVAEFEDRLYIVTNNQKKVYQQLSANPKVEICASGKDGSWMRLEAKAVHDGRKEARIEMINQNNVLNSMYTADDGVMEVLYLTDVTATFYSFSDDPKTITF